MKIAILAVNHNLYSHKRLYEAASDRGHEVIFLNTLQCYIGLSSNGPRVYYRGKQKIDDIDAVIPRIGSSITLYGTAVVRQFEMMNVYSLNGATAISRSRDKLRSLQLLARRGISMPISGFTHSKSDPRDVIELVKGAPLIIKLLEGTQGKGVVIAETNQAAESVISAFQGLNADILIQEFIKEAEGRDIRCFVVGDKVVGSMERQAKSGEFRSNIHRGGEASPIKITKEEKQIAIKAAKILGLKVAGVDIIRSKEGPMLLEVNSSPGLSGIEKTTGKDIASEIIHYIEKHYKEHSKD